MRNILGIFTNRDSANDAVDELIENGYSTSKISIIARDMTVKVNENDPAGAVVQTATAGATTGAVVGGLAGLLVAAGAITVPGIGAILIGGPLLAALGITGGIATTVSAAATGALAGGIVGALVGLGLPRETAEIYSEGIKRGGVMLSVQVSDDEEGTVANILTSNGAENVQSLISK
jgi:hypothetical protein